MRNHATPRGPAAAAGRGPPTMGRMSHTEQLRLRLLGIRPTDRLAGYLGPLLVALYAGILRFWQLGRPDTLIFDETYYVKQAWSLVTFGTEHKVTEALAAKDATPSVDQVWAAGTPDVFGPSADFVVHPPVGKWVIALGELAGGVQNAWSWRLGVAVLGTISVYLLARAARRMFGSTVLGVVAGLLLTLDGQHFVHSRTGLLDMSVMFFALGGFCALLVDRDVSRERLARIVGGRRDAGMRFDDRRLRYGPWLGMRWWRLVAGVSLGLCIGTKWSGMYFLAVFGLMTVLWDMGARRAAGVHRWRTAAIFVDGPQAALTMVGAALVTYLVSWIGWFRSSTGWGRQWAAENPTDGIGALVPDGLRSLWKYHVDMWNFHLGLTSHHDYMSNPWSWMLQGRPTSFYYEGPHNGQQGCTVADCAKAITDLGNPAIWWAATLALPVLAFCCLAMRDWRAGAILAGFLAGYVPWFQYQERTIFTFYSVAFVPWVVLAVTYVVGLVLGRADAPPRRATWGRALVAGYVVLVVAVFLFFWPLYTAQVIPFEQWQWRMWFRSWV